mmetsp:Transcript_6877/g.22670  ORF Transcript_6877/g.22670 Transcript_6877/m.22670 type:complete len:217 (+) Transcript_6877:108-758(+)
MSSTRSSPGPTLPRQDRSLSSKMASSATRGGGSRISPGANVWRKPDPKSASCFRDVATTQSNFFPQRSTPDWNSSSESLFATMAASTRSGADMVASTAPSRRPCPRRTSWTRPSSRTTTPTTSSSPASTAGGRNSTGSSRRRGSTRRSSGRASATRSRRARSSSRRRASPTTPSSTTATCPGAGGSGPARTASRTSSGTRTARPCDGASAERRGGF